MTLGASARSMWVTTRLRVVVVVLSIASGCTGGPAPQAAPDAAAPMSLDAYLAVTEQWTRSAKIYDGLDFKASVSATYHTRPFRRAFAQTFPDLYGRGGEITRRELLELGDDVELSHNFLVGFFTADRKWNDLEDAESIWRVTLSASGGLSVDARTIESIEIDANLTAVYPHLGHFDDVYLVRFPRTSQGGDLVMASESTPFSLRFASALGVAKLSWNERTD